MEKFVTFLISFFMTVSLTGEPAANSAQAPVGSAYPESAVEFATALGCGINLGNSLDVADMLQYNPNISLAEYEKSWGNPLIAKEQFAAIHDAGFQTVRIPVSWAEHMDANATIQKEFLDRVQEVVDIALDSGLFVIIDTHHENWLNLDLNKKEQIQNQFSIVWKQIAVRFQNYDERLVFEGLNEARLKNSQYEWTSGTSELRDFVNTLNALFVSTVRGVGGNNTQRFLMVSPYCHRVEEDALKDLVLPNDDRLIVAVHLYEPSDFCLDTNSGKSWHSDTNALQAMEQKFSMLNDYFVSKNVPVIITEFGCIDKGNTQDRMNWTRDFVGFCNKFGISYLWWDNGGDFQILNRETDTWVYPDIVEILTK